MTRRVVATEGMEFMPGVFLRLGCLKPLVGEIPIFTGFDSAILGTARDFERNEETGEISFDLDFQEEIDLELYDPSAYCTKVIERRKENMRIILQATVTGIYLVPIAAIPKAFSQE
jgi:hypothetical protein